MTTIQLREQLFHEMNPMLDSEEMLKKMIDYVRLLFVSQSNTAKQQTLSSIDHAFAQFGQMKEGQIEGIAAEDLLNEL